MSAPKPPFQKVLVANRGEIALRVMRTCRALGIRTVAIYSEADQDALHVRFADEAVCVGPAEARQSYLDIARVVAACQETGAEAVHPGYGFLSENGAFARALSDAGVVFVGPPADVLEKSGDKLVVKKRVAEGGAPVIPGPLGPVGESEAELTEAAAATGYPLILKASAGGGGKGMRRVDAAEDLVGAAQGARREAGGAFGNTELYLEKVIEPARHVEVQILADAEGTVWALGERDCSMQRRHQKVIEECPAPAMSEASRAELHEAGRRAARALDYQGAGTAEFLLGADGQVHFLEMNRRLQVEHPVTEACFGVDIVAWQLRVASGEALPPEPPYTAAQGHAIEARIYAEDPAHEFMPSPGRVLYARLPEGPGIRVDHAVATGSEISAHYDPMIAKVIAHGADRGEAIRRLDLALRETAIAGVTTNIAFLRTLLATEAFRDAELRVDRIDDEGANWTTPPDLGVVPGLVAAIHESVSAPARRNRGGSVAPTETAWDRLVGFRISEEV